MAEKERAEEQEQGRRAAAAGAGAREGTEGERERVINTAVATLWREPGLHRPLDKAAVAAAPDIRKWIAGMSVQDKRWLVGKLETQVLYGQKVKLLETRGRWAKVVVPGQPTSRNAEGYPGWVPLGQLAFVRPRPSEPFERPVAVVKHVTAWLYDDPAGASPYLELSFNTRLPIVREAGAYYAVQTPAAGEKYLRRADSAPPYPREAAAGPTGELLVNQAKHFLGLPYLWAGLSGFGFDCSGFTHALYGFFGIPIARDAADQFKGGAAVERDRLRPGDLLFFANDDGKGNVRHVGLYAGDGQMIHSPHSERSIELLSVDTPAYARQFAGAKRYLPD